MTPEPPVGGDIGEGLPAAGQDSVLPALDHSGHASDRLRTPADRCRVQYWFSVNMTSCLPDSLDQLGQRLPNLAAVIPTFECRHIQAPARSPCAYQPSASEISVLTSGSLSVSESSKSSFRILVSTGPLVANAAIAAARSSTSPILYNSKSGRTSLGSE